VSEKLDKNIDRGIIGTDFKKPSNANKELEKT